MIDPRIGMAMSVQARKGVYALLLGSGVSRPASIPTGWEVVTDLIRRIAKLSNEPEPADPEAWYATKMGRAATYSALLSELARSAADRSQLLKSYFEPTDDDRDAGKKLPTRAHRAIARLVRNGYIRVIVTTNFDRLIEQALHEESISARVISNEDTAKGATPFQHADCTIFKVNGDYLDLQTRNTSDELATYDATMSALLDRVFSEYGLIIAGWSGDWDAALRDAIVRNTRHRFSTYWMAHSTPAEMGQRIIDIRSAQIVEVKPADEVFEDLEQKVTSIEESRSIHPLSRDVAMATAKRYLSEDRFFIRLEELVTTETAFLTEKLQGKEFALDVPVPDEHSVTVRAQQAEAFSANLSAILMVGCYWGNKSHHRLWRQCLQSAIHFRSRSGTSYDWWRSMRSLPAAFIFYHAGIACLASEKLDVLHMLFSESYFVDENGKRQTIVELGAAGVAFHHNAANQLFPPNKNRKTPGSDWMHERLALTVGKFVGGELRYSDLFNRFELLVGMSYYHQNQGGILSGWRDDWMPAGRYSWHHSKPEYTPAVFKDEINAQGKNWAPLQAGFFDSSPDKALAAIEAVQSMWSKNQI